MVRLARNERGFTLIELLIVVAIIAILTTIITSLYTNIQARARLAKAQADVRAIASALSMYSTHCGGFPDNGSAATDCPIAVGQNGAMPSALLAPQTNAMNQVAGPFLNGTPALPGGWTGSGTSYKYATALAGTFLICASGDGTAAASDGGSTCP